MGSQLAAIPTLDEIAADPSVVDALPPGAVRALRARCIGVVAALMVADVPGPSKAPVPEDDFIGVHEVAALIGLSVSWVEKNPKKLPPRVSVCGHPRWRRSEIVAWMRSLPRYGELKEVASSTDAGVSGHRRAIR